MTALTLTTATCRQLHHNRHPPAADHAAADADDPLEVLDAERLHNELLDASLTAPGGGGEGAEMRDGVLVRMQ